MQLLFHAFCFAAANAGKSKLAKMAIMAMTTSNSINVKARLAFISSLDVREGHWFQIILGPNIIEALPLHCCSLFTSEYPAGDRGGNSFFIKPATRGIPLHSFRDGLLGTSGKAQAHLNYAMQLEHEHPRKSLKELKKAKTPKDWSTSHFEDSYGIMGLCFTVGLGLGAARFNDRAALFLNLPNLRPQRLQVRIA
jgi:hypothetical protein